MSNALGVLRKKKIIIIILCSTHGVRLGVCASGPKVKRSAISSSARTTEHCVRIAQSVDTKMRFSIEVLPWTLPGELTAAHGRSCAPFGKMVTRLKIVQKIVKSG